MEIRCLKCGWEGDSRELICNREDSKSNKPTNEIKFNICPQCDTVDNFEDADYEEEEE